MTLQFDDFVLAAATADLGEEPVAREHADAVEFRMDMAAEPLDALAAYDGDLPVIATNRAAWEGGEADDEGRLAALRAAAEHDAVAAVDVELAALTGDAAGPATADAAAATAAHARDHGASVIVSAHDFERTPPREALARLLERASEHGDVAKLAVTATDLDDALRVLGATRAAAADGLTVATMAMGPAGSHTRAVAPVYGSRIGYAPVAPERATAPGQYDLATLRALVDRLG
ncbi:type I 3-dehydroquinate dehydratase [Haloglomus irregulare]|jgi:3-dehydroquinate dehydratase-1|uniref:3-dehydroquinate dehydratase n=1 Tax=Haloglomus irregulare TaxID=2234134 RepID=A0A554NDE0_9EURY|nr:type I 3-dehydroquinate dehydratase [Haloglomus irregulare]TSD15409.1 type I 3-dehydroquinate dehydratase [Haloglomus irregulare]